VFYQPKAWVDRPLAVEWVEKSYSTLIKADEAAGVAVDGDEYLLLQDNLDAQLQPAYIAALKQQRTLPRWLLAGKTDYVQPVDAGLGRQMKLYIGEEMDKWLEDDDNLEKWESNSLSASDRRVLLTHWVGAAWAKAMAKPDTVRAYFVHTGALMTLAGQCEFKFDGVSEPFEFMHVTLPHGGDLAPQPRPDAADEPGSDVDDREPVLDEDDESDDDDVQMAQLQAPDGWRLVTTPPSAAALEFSRGESAAADELVGRTLLFNWAVVGWCVGKITRRNKDARRKLEGQPYNFLVHYEIDDQEAAHVLQLDMYAQANAQQKNQWTLLERCEPGPANQPPM
jgi:hypothetical protein